MAAWRSQLRAGPHHFVGVLDDSSVDLIRYDRRKYQVSFLAKVENLGVGQGRVNLSGLPHISPPFLHELTTYLVGYRLIHAEGQLGKLDHTPPVLDASITDLYGQSFGSEGLIRTSSRDLCSAELLAQLARAAARERKEFDHQTAVVR